MSAWNRRFCTTLNVKAPEILETTLPSMLPDCEILRDKKRYDENDEND